MRKATRGWIAGAIISLIALALVITLIPGALPRPADEIAKADGFSISVAEYDRELERRLDRAREAGQEATRAQVVEAGLHLSLRDEMIQDRALDRLARKAGIYVSDSVVGEEIRQVPAFNNQITSGFDKDTYQRLLAQNGFTTAEFEEGVRRDIARRQIVSAVTTSVSAPASYADFLISFETERRSIDIAEVTLSRVGEPPMPTEAQVEEAYKAASAQFATPEFRAVTVVIADTNAFAPRVEVAEEDLRKQYEFARARYNTPETRSFVQVTAPSADAARDAARRLAQGEDAEAIAAAIGGTAAAFEAVTKDKVIDPKVANAVFGLREAGATGAIQGELAWSAARVTAITPALRQPFETVREELRAELAAEEAESLVQVAVERFEDVVAEGRPIEEAAKEAGLEVRVIPQLDRNGVDAQRAPVADFAGDKDFLETVFATGEGEATDFMNLKSGPFALARVDRVTPPGVRPLEAVRAQVVNAWRGRWVSEEFTKIGNQVRDAVAAGQSFSEAAAAARIPVRQLGVEVDRRVTADGPDAALGRAVFAAREGEVVVVPRGAGAPSLAVARIAAITRPDPKTAPLEFRAQAQEAARQQIQQDFTQTLINAARTAAKVRANDAALNQLLGIDAASGDAAETP